MNKIRRMVVIGALAVACGALSFASPLTVTYQASFGPQTTDFSGATLTLPLFNATGALAGMSLTDVTLSLTVIDTVTSLSLTNNSSSTQNFQAQSYVYVDDCDGTSASATCLGKDLGVGPSVAADDQLALGQLILFNQNNITLGGTANVGNCPLSTPSSSCNSVQYATPIVKSGSATLDVGAFNLADLSAYIGPGNFTEEAETDTFTSTGGAGGNVAFNQQTNAQIYAYVTYSYAPTGTPEPATLFLMGSALVGVGLLRKRIKA